MDESRTPKKCVGPPDGRYWGKSNCGLCSSIFHKVNGSRPIMQSVLLSNIPHYHHLAEALHGSGLLKRYITSSTLLGDEEAAGWLPRNLRRKMEGRRLNNVPKD